jgi:hypothetical protein
MKVNIENMVRQASRCISGEHSGMYRHSLKELIDHLKEVKAAHEKGDSKEVLDGFFKLYVFSQEA